MKPNNKLNNKKDTQDIIIFSSNTKNILRLSIAYITCHPNCKECFGENSSQCSSCSDESNFILVDNKCVCKPSFYYDSTLTQCYRCPNQCQKCIQDQLNIKCQGCSSLIVESHNRKSFTESEECSCKDRFFSLNDNLQCNPCSITCLTCKGALDTDCLSCSILDYRIWTNNQCLCSNESVENNPIEQACIPCHVTCKTCSQGNSLNKCLSCYSNREIKNDYCVCKEGTYQNEYGDCIACDPTCKSCSGPFSNQCLDCKTTQNRVLDGNTCVCKRKYFQIDIDSTDCQQCHYSCEICTGPSKNECSECNPDTKRIQDGQACQCQGGFYDDGIEYCSPCHTTCENCIGGSENECSSCLAINNRQLKGSKCDCMDSFTEFIPRKTNCNSCHLSCETCFGAGSDQCKTCDSKQNRILDSNSMCVCNKGFYEDPISLLCKPCDLTCETCNGPSNTNCTLCSPGDNRILTIGVCGCMLNYAEYSTPQKKCKYNLPCDTSCESCSGSTANECLTCNAAENRELQGTICVCKSGFYDFSGICTSCHVSCKTCSGGQANNCDSCEDWRELSVSNCQCQADQIEFDVVQSKCKYIGACHDSCKKCKGPNPDQCEECEINDQRILDSNHNCICKDGYFDDGLNTQCQPCHFSCATCSGKGEFKCQSCKQKFNREFNPINFSCDCKVNYSEFSSPIPQCKFNNCHYSCKTCTGPSNNECTECDNTNLNVSLSDNNECLCKDNLCQKCIDNCKTCNQNSSLSCEQCDTDYTFNPQTQTCNKNQISSNYSEKTIKTVKQASEISAEVVIGISAGSSIIMSIVSPNANFLQQFLTIQKINFLLLINFTFPELLYQFSKSISGTNPLQILQKINFFTEIIQEKDKSLEYLNEGKFKQEDIKTSIIHNLGGIVIVIIINIILFILAVFFQFKTNKTINNQLSDKKGILISYASHNANNQANQPIYQIILNKILGIITHSNHELLILVLTFSIALQVLSFNCNGVDSEWSILAFKGVLLCIIPLYSVIFFFFYARFINNHYKMNCKSDDPSLNNIIFINYIQDSIINLPLQRNYRLIYILVEGMFIPLSLIVLYQNPILQLSFSLFFQTCMFVFTLLIRPNQYLLKNTELILQNTVWIVIFSLYLVVEGKVNKLNLKEISQNEIDVLNSLSIGIMVCCLILLFSSPIFIIVKFIFSIPEILKWIKQKLNKPQQQNQILNESYQSQSDNNLCNNNSLNIEHPKIQMKSFITKNTQLKTEKNQSSIYYKSKIVTIK